MLFLKSVECFWYAFFKKRIFGTLFLKKRSVLARPTAALAPRAALATRLVRLVLASPILIRLVLASPILVLTS